MIEEEFRCRQPFASWWADAAARGVAYGAIVLLLFCVLMVAVG